jgi:PAS domain S-box-containing protein
MNAQLAPSILIVEDERIVAKDLQQTLNEMGYDAFAVAASAEEALACATRRHPDLVLMDIRIKGQDDGISTASLLKNRFSVAVIYLTAHADEAMLDRAKRTEPHGYLVKPVKAAELRSMIEITLHRQALERAREKLRANERRLFLITDNVPVSIGYFDRQGRVQFANRVFREMVDFEEPSEGVSANQFLGEPLYKESYNARQRALAGETVHFMVRLSRAGRERSYEISYLPDHGEQGGIEGVYALGYDVTVREQLAAELRQARLDLETILDHVPAGITSWRVDLTNRFANRAAQAQFGVDPREAPGMHLQDLFGRDAYARAQPSIEAALRGARSAHVQLYERPDGSVRYRHDEYVPELDNGAIAGLYALSMDITELRESHDRVRDLAQRLETVREEERRKVAAILHDGIAQDLFALKLGIDHIEALAKRQAGIRKICRELAQAISACMDETRDLANELRPVTLNYFSIGTVLRELAQRFAAISHLDIQVDEGTDLPSYDETMQLLLFRAAQEALTNVARHAQAAHVQISLKGEGETIVLQVIDDGIGISASAFTKARSLGLLSLKERFEALGGRFEVRRNEPRGTIVTASLTRRAGSADT